jgi:hypothetical protein
MSNKINWDRTRASKLAKEYLDFPQAGSLNDQKRWYRECGSFLKLDRIDPTEYIGLVKNRKTADARRNFQREIIKVQKFLHYNFQELNSSDLLNIIFKDYQRALRDFLDNDPTFQIDHFPDIVAAIQFFKLKRVQLASKPGKLVWSIEN